MNGYDLSRQWFDFAFENPDLVTGNHAAVYLWNVELNNRMGWSKKFSSPASQSMAAAGIKSYNTYKKVFKDLIEWGFIKVIKESQNQYQANVIALSNFDKSLDKSLDKAMTNHSEITSQITDDIIKQRNKETKKQIVAADGVQTSVLFDLKENEKAIMICQVLRASCQEYFKSNKAKYDQEMYSEFIEYWSVPNTKGIPRWYKEKTKKDGTWSLPQRLSNWSKNYKPKFGTQPKPSFKIPDRLKPEKV